MTIIEDMKNMVSTFENSYTEINRVLKEARDENQVLQAKLGKMQKGNERLLELEKENAKLQEFVDAFNALQKMTKKGD